MNNELPATLQVCGTGSGSVSHWIHEGDDTTVCGKGNVVWRRPADRTRADRMASCFRCAKSARRGY